VKVTLFVCTGGGVLIRMRFSAILLVCCSVALLLPGAFAETSVITWGRPSNANGSNTNIPPDLTNVVAISASGYPSIALRADGTAVAWGEGLINSGPRWPNVVAVDAGYNHVMALQHDGTLVARGYYGTTSNQMIRPVGTPPALSGVTAFTCGGFHDVALLKDGSLVAWGLGFLQTNAPSLHGVTAIDAGRLHTLALTEGGTVLAWGDNAYGQCDVPEDLTDAVAIAAGHFFSVVLKSDGSLVGWGDNTFNQLNFPPDATNIVAVSAGRNHCFARRNDGTLMAWGDNTDGQATIPADLPHVLAFSAGGYHNIVLAGPSAPTIYPQNQTVHVGLRANFTVLGGGVGRLRYQWRRDGNDIPGATNTLLTLTNTQPTDAGVYTVVVTDSNGSVVSDPALLTVVAAPFIFRQPASQTNHLYGTVTFLVGADGTAPYSYQWQFEGTNIPGATNQILRFTPTSLGQSGRYSVVVSNPLGSVTSSNALLTLSPVATWGRDIGSRPTPSNVVAFSTRVNSTLFLTSDGTVLLWNMFGGLPPPPPNLTNIIAVAAGTTHALALRRDRTVVAWGVHPNGVSQYSATNVPAGLIDVVAISAGYGHSLALKSDGTVVGWGGSGGAVPEGLSNVVEIAAGGGYSLSLALKQDGTIVTWPTTRESQLPPPELTNAVALAASYWSIALTDAGTPVVWNSNVGPNILNIPPTLTNVTALAPAGFFALALRSDRTVSSWGFGNYGGSNVPLGLTNVVAIAAGDEHGHALVAEDLDAFTPPHISLIPSSEAFAVSFPTRRGWRYRLEYKDSLSDKRWTMLPRSRGTARCRWRLTRSHRRRAGSTACGNCTEEARFPSKFRKIPVDLSGVFVKFSALWIRRNEDIFAESGYGPAQMACNRCQWRCAGPAGCADRGHPAGQEQAQFCAASRRWRFRRGHQRRKSRLDRQKGNQQDLHELFGVERRGEIPHRGADSRQTPGKADHPCGSRHGAEKPPRPGPHDQAESLQRRPASSRRPTTGLPRPGQVIHFYGRQGF
jgi:alpha-tubulin suppressor-like RCC1 family protein